MGKRIKESNEDNITTKRIKCDHGRVVHSIVKVNPNIAKIWQNLGDFNCGPEV